MDDNPVIMLDVADHLTDAGFSVFTAGDGAGAYRLLEVRGKKTALLYIDVELPGGVNGFAVARVVAERFPTIAIIVSSGSVNPQASDMPFGAIFLPMPYSTANLLACARKVIATKIPALAAGGQLAL